MKKERCLTRRSSLSLTTTSSSCNDLARLINHSAKSFSSSFCSWISTSFYMTTHLSLTNSFRSYLSLNLPVLSNNTLFSSSKRSTTNTSSVTLWSSTLTRSSSSLVLLECSSWALTRSASIHSNNFTSFVESWARWSTSWRASSNAAWAEVRSAAREALAFYSFALMEHFRKTKEPAMLTCRSPYRPWVCFSTTSCALSCSCNAWSKNRLPCIAYWMKNKIWHTTTLIWALCNLVLCLALKRRRAFDHLLVFLHLPFLLYHLNFIWFLF